MISILSLKKVWVYRRIILIALLSAVIVEILLISCGLTKAFAVFHSDSRKDISLLKVYEDQDITGAGQYFRNWKEESLQLTKTEYGDKLEESLYGIYRAVFKPYYLEPLTKEGERLGYFEQDLIEVINRTPYVVTQNKINYIIRDFHEIEGQDLFEYFIFNRIRRDEIHTLEDFYPKVDLNEGKVLHLTKRYEDELNLFLGAEEQPFGKGSIMAPAKPKGETLKRYEFIRNYIPVLYGHWGGYWHLITHPEIGYVILDKELDQAIAEYRIGYEFGYAQVRRTDGEYRITRAILNGIE